ncbi:hypothetical protein [Aliiroseovarius subalbicans]|uniref:hypothetical protein n=1 Tax=Aliiroseovarius subalbicans TaxID=2925840 RepID=UPI001F55DF8F|nr:hypothetical protein [Aliiroseovarius subalbicans]MCI2399287.1 hypothetical protein [Aliiroseovarius subalbicans]
MRLEHRVRRLEDLRPAKSDQVTILYRIVCVARDENGAPCPGEEYYGRAYVTGFGSLQLEDGETQEAFLERVEQAEKEAVHDD